ncbi:hypothetical protein [Variovorax paradoxus]|uniref:hypothetical protein n=1 Tax=Variovorax paradoxus TaxID=34073 RepID=UPI001F343A55|nr:hypothetical protein [Variovorax paradoxus]UKI08294.1 hypothetical protein L3V85_37015 [Variovorax paradoxus]
MSGAQVALFIAFVVVATLAQGLTGFAFVLLLGLAGLFQLAPVTDLANVATTLAVLGAAAMLRTSLRHVDRTAYLEAVAGSAPGVLAGVMLLKWLSANVMTVLGVTLGVTIRVRDHHVAAGKRAASTVQRHLVRRFRPALGTAGRPVSAGGPRLCTTSTDSPCQWKHCGPPWSPR